MSCFAATEDRGESSFTSIVYLQFNFYLEEDKSLDTLGETLQANGLRVRGAYRRHDRLWGGEEPDDARLLQAAESLGERRVLVSAGEHSLSITPKEINGTGYQIFVYGSRGGEKWLSE